MNIEESNTYNFNNIELNHIIKVTYLDRLGNEKSQYFYNQTMKEKIEVEQYIKFYKKIFPLQLDSISFENLNSYFKKLKFKIDIHKNPDWY